MIFLPIVGRELRVAARRRGTFWTRSVVALFAILISVVIFLVSYGSPPHDVGEAIFWGLAILCLVYCILSGRFSTADCLSGEKREGTLGLLFLTDLKGYDIVFGKLVSTSVGALYALFAVLPVMALPLLMGGVTNGEFWRTVLALVITFLFSLAIGIFGSAVSRESRRAAAADLVLSVFFMAGVPFGLMGIIYWLSNAVESSVLLTCPGFTLFMANDNEYKSNPNLFWFSVAAIGMLAFCLIALACIIVPRTWQDKPMAPARGRKITWRGFWRAINYGRAAKVPPFRKRLLDRNAFYWLAGKERLKPLHVWIFLGLMAFWWILGWADSGMLWFDPVTAVTLALILNGTLKVWIAVESSQQLAEDQRSGALELVLATPLTGLNIVEGQYLALWRQFFRPLLLTIAVEIFLMVTVSLHSNGSERTTDLEYWLAGIGMLMIDVVALPLVGMRSALTAKNPSRATIGTISRILVLPWALFGLTVLVWTIWVQLRSPLNQTQDFLNEGPLIAIWAGAGIATDLFFGIRAWKQLSRNFRQLATSRFSPHTKKAKKSFPWRKILAMFRPSKRKIIVAVVLVAGVAGYFILHEPEPNFPPPVEVSITRKIGPLRAFPSWSSFLILPDGSLWHWGRTGNGNATDKHTVPVRVGTNENWLQISGTGFVGAGLQKDGTIWEWNGRSTVIKPQRVGFYTNWLSVSMDFRRSAALRNDGTISEWDWKNPLPIQVATNSDWASVFCQQNITVALKTNGTVWIWGQASFRNLMKSFAEPTQVCRETNWVAITTGSGERPWAWTASGEVRQLNLSVASPQATAAEASELLTSNSAPDRLVAAFVGKPELFELRNDGTLWEKTFSPGPWYSASPDEKWHQAGRRADWQGIWGNGDTAFGLTADGMLWTWGLDPSRDGTWSLSARFRMLGIRIRSLFGNRPGVGGYGTPMAIQKTPRPLMRLIDSTLP
jgi:ABC-type transport system involved in cytochrome c biogenesis permease component